MGYVFLGKKKGLNTFRLVFVSGSFLHLDLSFVPPHSTTDVEEVLRSWTLIQSSNTAV